MKLNHRHLTAVLLAAALLTVLFLGTAAADSPYNVTGTGSGPVTFTVNVWSANATITLTQERGTFVYSNGYYSALSWGCYHVDCMVNGVSNRADWNSTTGRETFTLSLKRTGTYTITVTPYADDEMRQQVGYFGTWRTPPAWGLTAASGCQPAQGSGTGTGSQTGGKNVTVEYRDAYGNVLQQSTHYCTQGTNTITAPATLQGGMYRRISVESQNVTLYANGSLSTNTLTFYYVSTTVNTVTPSPAPAALTATVWIYYYDTAGNLLQTTSQTVRQGTSTVTAPASLMNDQYYRTSAASQSVTLYANGSLSPASLRFTYARRVTPTPVPTTATVMIYYYDEYGSLLQTTSQTVRQGTTTITAPSQLMNNQYYRTSAASQSVTLYANGSLSPTSLRFTYARRVTPTPVPTTATVWVYYCDGYGNVLQTKSVTVRQGTNSITAPATLSGGKYNLTSSASQTVTLSSGGALSTSAVYFYYQEYIPVTGTVTIHNYDVDEMRILSTRTQTLQQGTHRVNAGSAPSGYRLYSESYVNVTVNADGSVTPSEIYFEYKRKSATNPPVTAKPSSNVGPEVYPTQWETQFVAGSTNPNAVNDLPNLYDNNLNTSFHYIYWNGDVKDGIPELTCYFNGATVSTLGLTSGKVRSYSDFTENSKPSSLDLVIYCDQGVVERTVPIPKGFYQEVRPYSLGGTFTGVTKIEIFVAHIWVGDVNKYDVHISEMKFFE